MLRPNQMSPARPFVSDGKLPIGRRIVLVGGLRDADVGVNGIRVGDFGKRQSGRRRDLGEGVTRRRLLLRARVDMVVADALGVEADAVIVRARSRETVGEVQGAPLGADQGGVDVAVARKEVASVRIGAERQQHADISAFRVGEARVGGRAAAFLAHGLVMVVRDRQFLDRDPLAKTRQTVAGRRVLDGSVGGRRADADLEAGGAPVASGRADADRRRRRIK